MKYKTIDKVPEIGNTIWVTNAQKAEVRTVVVEDIYEKKNSIVLLLNENSGIYNDMIILRKASEVVTRYEGKKWSIKNNYFLDETIAKKRVGKFLKTLLARHRLDRPELLKLKFRDSNINAITNQIEDPTTFIKNVEVFIEKYPEEFL